MKYFRNSLIVAVVFFIASACEKNDDNPDPKMITFIANGLEGRIINELTTSNNLIVAATDNGLYSKTIGTDQWQSAGLATINVRTFIQINQNLWLAAEKELAQESFRIFKSENKGLNWTEIDSNYGKDFPEQINDFEYISGTQKLYAAGNAVIAESTDLGETWTPVVGDWGFVATGLDFVVKHPTQDFLWAGGQNGIEGFTLNRYDIIQDANQSWINLIPSPSTAKAILFDPTDAGKITIGAEGGIIQSTDDGDNWEILKEEENVGRFIFGLARNNSTPQTIYAAGWVKNFDTPQALILSVSRDNGASWEYHVHNDNTLFGGVWDMISVTENGKQVLYLGLFKGGVYKVILD
ncbi:hypothetical protein QQ008_25205 [Fulvivirgaceae bacterium BMA10]|uniref:Photosynthesis system II assembly factor Ycf48/Hcf136-like domain-containing protein n=1 Tax=Splendidivirga corallicola TaxID=3051826 RepID=A0ABT8KVB8_9BACT|nr:hypothetical protein [Fulvivirgaceae bacterium BMA10]